MARLGPLEHSPRDSDGPFWALARAIVYQQLAGRAAQAIYTRVRAAVGPAPTPETLAAVSDGVSGAEACAISELSPRI